MTLVIKAFDFFFTLLSQKTDETETETEVWDKSNREEKRRRGAARLHSLAMKNEKR